MKTIIGLILVLAIVTIKFGTCCVKSPLNLPYKLPYLNHTG